MPTSRFVLVFVGLLDCLHEYEAQDYQTYLEISLGAIARGVGDAPGKFVRTIALHLNYIERVHPILAYHRARFFQEAECRRRYWR